MAGGALRHPARADCQGAAEPCGVQRGDEAWFTLVKWVLFALIEAEEHGVTRDTVRTLATSRAPAPRAAPAPQPVPPDVVYVPGLWDGLAGGELPAVSAVHATGAPELVAIFLTCYRFLIPQRSETPTYGSPIFKAVQQKRCTALYFQRVYPVIAYQLSLICDGGLASQFMGVGLHTPPGQQPPTTRLATTIRATMNIVIRFII